VISTRVRSAIRYWKYSWILLVTLICTLVCSWRVSTPVSADAESPFCSLPPDPATPWLPVTPEPNESIVPSPRPASDCQFYRPAWQRFLVATQPTDGMPAFLRYPSFNEVFPTTPPSKNKPGTETEAVLDLLPRNIQRPNDPDPTQQKLLDDTQAGINGAQGGYLIDQHGRFIYYAIHINPGFLQFLRNQKLLNVSGIQQIDTNLTVLGGKTGDDGNPDNSDILTGINTNIVEYKSAWMIVDKDHPPPNYFVVSARVPHFIVSGNSLIQEKRDGVPKTDQVKVALLALHVVFTLPGHPEMIWSTFEHVHKAPNGEIVRDNAPAASDNPSFVDPNQEVTKDDFPFPLYKAHTLLKDANQPIDQLSSIVQSWDQGSQSFTKGGKIIQTSVYRPYPGSKTDGSKKPPDPSDRKEDNEITAINLHATSMFDDAKSRQLISDDDQRQNYRLVGAIWLDQPMSGPKPFFTFNKKFSIANDQSTDDPGQPIAGEGRLGSTAMESFTERDDLAPNCFSCHDTRAIRRGDNTVVMGPARLNVSHLLSKYMISQLPSPPK
jgi:hypothetical protein